MVVRAAIDWLREDEGAREKQFRAMLQEGLDDDLAAGRFEVVSDPAAWVEGLARRPK